MEHVLCSRHCGSLGALWGTVLVLFELTALERVCVWVGHVKTTIKTQVCVHIVIHTVKGKHIERAKR